MQDANNYQRFNTVISWAPYYEQPLTWERLTSVGTTPTRLKDGWGGVSKATAADDNSCLKPVHMDSVWQHHYIITDQHWLGWFSGLNHTHSKTDVRMCTHTCTHTGIKKVKLRQLLGMESKKPRPTSGQRDDYLHDKDLKYSPQTFSPWSFSPSFPRTPPVQVIWFWHLGHFSKVWKALALTTHLPGLTALFFQCWVGEGSERP